MLYRVIDIAPSCHRYRVIAPSPSRHRAIVIAHSHHRAIASSSSRYRTIAPSRFFFFAFLFKCLQLYNSNKTIYVAKLSYYISKGFAGFNLILVKKLFLRYQMNIYTNLKLELSKRPHPLSSGNKVQTPNLTL